MKQFILLVWLSSFAFVASSYAGLESLPSTCIQAVDECGNSCSRMTNSITDWACTRMTCTATQEARCTMSTSTDWSLLNSTWSGTTLIGGIQDSHGCYTSAGYTWSDILQQCVRAWETTTGNKLESFNTTTCIQAINECGNMCHRPAPTTSTGIWTNDWTCGTNACVAQSATCLMSTDDEIPTQVPPVVGGDKDAHGCIGSAGYSWSQSKQTCVRTWEYDATDDEKAYDFAFNMGMTSMKTVTAFRLDDKITRQEAAKMLVAYAENAFDAKYASYPDDCNVAYLDDKSFDSTLKDYIYSACAHNIMKGSKKSFMPQENLTRGQTLAIMMRIVDGRQNESGQPRWIKYVDRATELGYLAFANTKGFENAITRWEVIDWAYTIYTKKISSQQ